MVTNTRDGGAERALFGACLKARKGCGALPGTPCVTASGKVRKEVHRARVEASFFIARMKEYSKPPESYRGHFVCSICMQEGNFRNLTLDCGHPRRYAQVVEFAAITVLMPEKAVAIYKGVTRNG